MKKVLFVAHVVKHHFMTFHIPYIKWFKENDYETHVCARNDYENKEECNIPYCDKYYDIPFERSPFNSNNIVAYKQLKKIIDSNDYEIIHCHTPVGGVLTRLAAREARKRGTRVIYTAHGFHFFKGAPIINWMLFYPVERFCARYTDILITINKEDYNRAKKSFKAGRIEYIPGVGIDTKKFIECVVDKSAKRKELGVPDNAFLVLSVGELNKNKNHETVIKAIAKLNNLNVYYVICGQGVLEEYLKDLIKELGLEKQVKLLGYRRDIAEISKAADVFVFPSFREGLGLAALEAMASGLPIITSNVHGIVDYSINGVTGYNCNPNDVYKFSEVIERLANSHDLRFKMGRKNIENVKRFDIKNSKDRMKNIYGEVLFNEPRESEHYSSSL
ncbi:glycosyltransferase family 4 protein [Clostridium cochlearium]|uniref:glycosyltransferase family 4 protein n=1 Tax=Clostridium cochlearium TaxID=1494 RepID=UPI0022E852FF|nr:glycosyltransferase family 4 protein [Clostridium cochlearium]